MRLNLAAWCGAVVFAAAVGALSVGAAVAQTQPTATAVLRDAAGQMVATADLREMPDQVEITLAFARTSPLTGTLALHIHELGRCDPPDFASAGGILNPFGKQHGLLNPDGPMAGDLPDLVLGPTGLAQRTTTPPARAVAS